MTLNEARAQFPVGALVKGAEGCSIHPEWRAKIVSMENTSIFSRVTGDRRRVDGEKPVALMHHVRHWDGHDMTKEMSAEWIYLDQVYLHIVYAPVEVKKTSLTPASSYLEEFGF